jgi:hypothetical protein
MHAFLLRVLVRKLRTMLIVIRSFGLLQFEALT